MINSIWLIIFYKHIWWWPQVYDEFKECGKLMKFKIVKVVNLTSLQDLAICFWALNLLISLAKKR